MTATDIFNDWPNNSGFDVFHEETTPVELTVKGQIPEYVRGVLYRTGPGNYTVPTEKGTTFTMQHWFDGFGQTHRFQLLSPTKVLYNSRRSCDELIEHIRSTGSLPSSFSFAQRRDPCQSLWRKFFTTFHSEYSQLRGPSGANICVTLSLDMPGLPATASDGKRSLYAKTDATVLQGLDPETLEPVGICNQTKLHPELKGQLSSAHSQRCPETSDTFNYNTELGKTTKYRVFRVCAATGKTEILATITDAPAAYIHSFFLTKNYVVLCVFSAHFGLGGLKILYHKNMLDALDDVAPHKKALWYVVPRKVGSAAIKKYSGRAFFAFHSANAWEENGGIVAEVPAFDSIDIIKKFYLNHIKADSAEARKWVDKAKPSYTRFWLPEVEKVGTGFVETVWERPGDVSMELPAINPLYKTKPHRFTYGLVFRGKSTMMDGLVKHDNSPEQKHLLWEKHAHTPGEAIFIPDPAGTEEDDGVLLTVVLDGRSGLSYLLVLDAKTMREVARAEMDWAVPLGFHGTFGRI